MERFRCSAFCSLILLIFLAASPAVFAEPPGQINFQGRLTDESGVSVPEDYYDMRFALYDAITGGAVLWSETQSVWVTGGIYSVVLGEPGNELPVEIFSSDLYLGVTVGADEEMMPRQKLTSVAFALKARDADTVGGLSPGDFLSSTAPAAISVMDDGYALSVANNGAGGAALLNGDVNVDYGSLLVQGDGSFDEDGEAGVLFLGDSANYIQAIHGFGVTVGTFNAADAIVVQQGTGNVGIGTPDPAVKLDVQGAMNASGTLTVGSGDKNLAIFTDGAVVDIKSTGAALGINYPGDTDTVINVNGGRVGIGVDPPSEKLSVNGAVESKSGGFKYPDGSLQATAGYSRAHVDALEARIALLESKIAALENLLANVTREGNEVIFSGVNVHIVNGTGATYGVPNAVGNLIVGYNEVRGDGDDRSGSHNVVIGMENNYSSYGGLVAGEQNTISGQCASVSGGEGNTASGNRASVAGGYFNTASGGGSAVAGGYNNTAVNVWDTVVGDAGQVYVDDIPVH